MQFSKPKVSTEESCSSLDWPARMRSPGGGGGSKDFPAILLSNFVQFLISIFGLIIWATFGWRNREARITGGHSSVVLDRGLDPRQEADYACEDRIFLILAGGVQGKHLADDADEGVAVGIVLIFYCQRSPTVALRKNVVYMFRLWHVYIHVHNLSGASRSFVEICQPIFSTTLII